MGLNNIGITTLTLEGLETSSMTSSFDRHRPFPIRG